MITNKTGNSTFCLVNGHRAESIPVNDRGLLFGDSIFTTMKVIAGKIELLDAHLTRLLRDAKALGFPPISKKLLRADLRALPTAGEEAGTIRFTVSRGSGPRGYRIPPLTEPRRIAQWFPGNKINLPEKGINLKICTTRLASQPLTAGLKHGNRLEQVLARSEWADETFYEGLMLDYQDRVVEGTCSNFFLIDKQRLITPKLEDCGVKGVMRDLVFRVSRSMGVPVKEIDLELNALHDSRSGFISNALIGIVPVARLEQTDWTLPPLFASLKSHIQDELQKSLMVP